ncbi:50S ribosomal protein L17 [Patescibacteria group bacterium]|nr:50S ribosomal protein L17 [Patescibacteria group bacterium]
MRHKKKGRKLGRKKNARKGLLKALAVSLVKSEKIKTTEAKAKELRPFIEKLLTKAREEKLSNRRLIIAKIGEAPAKKLFEKIGPKYKNRKGGYTRIIKLARRQGDASKMAVIEFV